jgi:hypothetical protein
VTIGEHEFTAALSSDVLSTVDRLSVNGVTLSTRTMSLDEWIEGLLVALRAESTRSQSARLAMERLLSG